MKMMHADLTLLLAPDVLPVAYACDASPEVRDVMSAFLRDAGVANVAHAWRRIRVRGSRADCARAIATIRTSHVANALVTVIGLESIAGA